MKSKKLIPVFAVLTAVCIFILTAFGACSSGGSSSEGRGTTPPDIPGGGEFVNPGDNLGGGVNVSVGKNEETHIFLKNATIKNTDGIAFYNENKKSTLIITALNGTENVIENGGTYSLYDGETELTTFTISSIITSVGSNGGMGGQGGPGGQGGQPGRPGGNR